MQTHREGHRRGGRGRVGTDRLAIGSDFLLDDEVVLLDASASFPMRLHPSRRVRVYL